MEHPRDLMDQVLALYPDFKAAWDDEASIWAEDDGSYTFHGFFAVLSHYVADLLEKGYYTEHLRPLFAWVERKLTGSDPNLTDAAGSCFLENLMNRVPDRYEFESFESALGPASRKLCRGMLD